MEKKFYANIEYNKRKKSGGITLSMLLVVMMLLTISTFVATKQYTFIAFFAALLLLPAFLIPRIIKNYPTDGRAIIVIKDKEVIMDGTTTKLKDITLIRVTIELPASKLDSENNALLEEMKSQKPNAEFFGNLDLVVKDLKGEKRVLYSHIDNVMQALETLLELGVKHYEILYSVKKKSVKCEYDVKKDIVVQKENSLTSTSTKDRKKQLL